MVTSVKMTFNQWKTRFDQRAGHSLFKSEKENDGSSNLKTDVPRENFAQVFSGETYEAFVLNANQAFFSENGSCYYTQGNFTPCIVDQIFLIDSNRKSMDV